MEMAAADIHKDNNEMEMDASKYIQTQMCHTLSNFDRVKVFLHDSISGPLPALCCLCAPCDLKPDLGCAHPYNHSSFLPPSLDSFAIMLPSRGGMDAFNHLSYQLCAKQQTR